MVSSSEIRVNQTKPKRCVMEKRDGTSLLIRLGRALYWGGCVVMVICFGFSVYIFITFHKMDESMYFSGVPTVAVSGPLIWGILAILFGRAARYVLANE